MNLFEPTIEKGIEIIRSQFGFGPVLEPREVEERGETEGS